MVDYTSYFGRVGQRVRSTWDLGSLGTVIEFDPSTMESVVQWDAGYITLCTKFDIDPLEEN